MFTTEQHIAPKSNERPEKGLFRTGMVLVKPKAVSRRFTYRELTLVLGVCVALIVALTVWSAKKNTSHPGNSSMSATVVDAPLYDLVKRSVSFVTTVGY